MGARQIILSLLLPGAAAAVALIAAAVYRRWCDRKTQADSEHKPRSLSWLVVLLIAAGVSLGSYGWQTRLDLWPRQAPFRFPHAAAIGCLAGLVVAMLPAVRRAWALAALAAVGGASAAWLFLSLLHESLISEPARWTWIVLSGAGAAAQAMVLERVADRLPGWRAPMLSAVLAALIALGATMSFANAPLVLGPVGAVLGGAMLAAIIAPRLVLMPGVGVTSAIMFVATITFANWFGDRERWMMYALLMAAPVATGLCLCPPFSRRGATVRLLAAAVPALALAGAQAARAIPPLVRSMSQPSDAYDY